MIRIIAIPVDGEGKALHFSDEKSCMDYFGINRVQLTALLNDHINDKVGGYFLDKEIVQERKKRKVSEV